MVGQNGKHAAAVATAPTERELLEYLLKPLKEIADEDTRTVAAAMVGEALEQGRNMQNRIVSYARSSNGLQRLSPIGIGNHASCNMLQDKLGTLGIKQDIIGLIDMRMRDILEAHAHVNGVER